MHQKKTKNLRDQKQRFSKAVINRHPTLSWKYYRRSRIPNAWPGQIQDIKYVDLSIPIVTHKVGGNNVILGVTQDSFQFSLGLLPEKNPK